MIVHTVSQFPMVQYLVDGVKRSETACLRSRLTGAFRGAKLTRVAVVSPCKKRKGLLTFSFMFAPFALHCFSSPAAFITACMCGCIRDLGLVEGMGRICTATHTSHTPLSVPIHTPLDGTLPSFANGRMQRVSGGLIFRARI